MIRFDHVSKHYTGNVAALDDISVELKDGDFVFLIGPSGAGKTTLLRLLIGETRPSSGNVIIDTTDIQSIPKGKLHILRRKVGMIFQDFKLLPDRTVFENVAIALEILGKDRESTTKEVNAILSLVGLEKKRRMFPVQLSAGELQRASIARAIVAGPKILLADEPTGNLDPQTAWDILNILTEVNRIGTTIIMATHNVSIVDDMKKRTLTLERGKLVRDEASGRYRISSAGKKNHGD